MKLNFIETKKDLENFSERNNYKIIKGYGRVYVIQFEGLVKIGNTENIKTRIASIRNASGRNFIKCAYTNIISNHYDIESKMHKYFNKYKKVGEWFTIDFMTAFKYLESLDLKEFKIQKVSRDKLKNLLCNCDDIIKTNIEYFFKVDNFYKFKKEFDYNEILSLIDKLNCNLNDILCEDDDEHYEELDEYVKELEFMDTLNSQY